MDCSWLLRGRSIGDKVKAVGGGKASSFAGESGESMESNRQTFDAARQWMEARLRLTDERFGCCGSSFNKNKSAGEMRPRTRPGSRVNWCLLIQ